MQFVGYHPVQLYYSLVLETYPTHLLLLNIILINPINSVVNTIIFYAAPIIRVMCKYKFN